MRIGFMDNEHYSVENLKKNKKFSSCLKNWNGSGWQNLKIEWLKLCDGTVVFQIVEFCVDGKQSFMFLNISVVSGES